MTGRSEVTQRQGGWEIVGLCFEIGPQGFSALADLDDLTLQVLERRDCAKTRSKSYVKGVRGRLKENAESRRRVCMKLEK
jgi:hypothetical protein